MFNRLDLSVDFYNKATSDMLMTIPYMHFPASSSGRNNEKREKKPNTVPTGQTVLQ